jgi:hypothetical protein
MLLNKSQELLSYSKKKIISSERSDKFISKVSSKMWWIRCLNNSQITNCVSDQQARLFDFFSLLTYFWFIVIVGEYFKYLLPDDLTRD